MKDAGERNFKKHTMKTTEFQRRRGLMSRAMLFGLGASAIFGAVDRSTLPISPEPFRGKIGTTYKDSAFEVPTPLSAPRGVPNVLVVLLDDAGYAQSGTFGSTIPTPTLDRLASTGLRYTRFHVTGMCSPSRAALLTGRNHHSVSMGVISNWSNEFPGYTSSIPKSAAFVSEVLRSNGYATAAIGKWHMIPDSEATTSGPFDHWPTRQGFDYYYGFIGAETDQWHPAVTEGTQPVQMQLPQGREEDYTLNDALADKAIAWIKAEKSLTPDRPFFIYYAPGATHAPLQAPRKWVDQFRGKFDMGWDRYREIVFERQKRLGVVPADTQLTPRPPEIPAWESLTKDERRVYARMMEVYAGFMAQSDYDIGRVIDTIRDVGALDNTMVIYIAGDNGASFEGNLSGTTNVMAQVNGVAESTAEMLERLDDLGGPSTTPMYPAGWAWAGNTPFQWGKRIASHLGGTRDPLVISWPKRIRDIGGVRTQFHHLIDVAPTILEAASIPAPASVNGVVQKPIEGVSMIYTFDEPKAAGRHETQYFELLANRSIYHDGWIAAARSGLLPWAYLLKGDFEREPWELYHLDVDYSEANNLADQFPDKLKALEKLFDEEARKNQVYPLDPRVAGYPHENSAPPGGRAFYTFYQGSGHLYDATAPRTVNRSYEFRAYVVIPPGGANGVLVAHGGSACGYSLFLKDGKPTYTYNFFQREVTTLASPQPLPEGAATIQLRFEYEGGGAGKGAMAVLLVNGGEVDRRRIPRTVPFAYSFQETFDVGEDSSSPVGDYRSPFPFSGVLQRLELQVAPVKLASEEELRFRADRLAALLRSQ